jgi:thiamine phosphate synthase YjbQ (UPF0047 family)
MFGHVVVALCLLWVATVPTALALLQPGVFSVSRRSSRRSSLAMGGEFVAKYVEIKVETKKGIHLSDLTPQLKALLKESGCSEGTITVMSRHTTTAITVNEMEGRLVDDIRQWLLKLAPPEYPYLHNDLHLRSGPPNWPGGDEAWRAQEPVNCHSHLLTMLLGSSESVPVSNGELKTGTWQSVILAEMDGPRTRTVGVQITGVKA